MIPVAVHHFALFVFRILQFTCNSSFVSGVGRRCSPLSTPVVHLFFQSCSMGFSRSIGLLPRSLYVSHVISRCWSSFNFHMSHLTTPTQIHTPAATNHTNTQLSALGCGTHGAPCSPFIYCPSHRLFSCLSSRPCCQLFSVSLFPPVACHRSQRFF